MGLRAATAINVATMVGAGPFITLPLVVGALHGSVSAAAWVAGAIIALCDGLVWAELAARFPRSGGTYVYLREAFGARGPGRLFAFLFVWQFIFWAPLILASGYIGFAQYAAYLLPALGSPVATHALAAGVGIVTLVALYRAIPQIARLGLFLGAVALVTLVVVALAGLGHPHQPLAASAGATLGFGFGLPALGAALVITLYDYAGYADVCALGDEVIAPSRTMPRAIVLSVLFVGAAYLLLNLGAVSALPAAEIAKSTTVASTIAERALGVPFAIVVTLAILVTAFGSTFGNLLAASRVPFAAARDGDFLPGFARLHRDGFPSVSLLVIGLAALPASLFPLDAVINALTAGIVLIQGVTQIVALAVVRRRAPAAPFRVPLYPVPPLVALIGWLFLFVSTGAAAIAFGLATLALGAAIFLVRARLTRAWPFAAALGALALTLALPHPALAAPSFGHATIVRRDGEPRLLVDGTPFFFWGGAFFYERISPERWRASMLAMRALGANTLDLYVPWSWHEVADGTFDFDGRTDPRRNLREVLRLGAELGFRFVVRPGPVIRNEWRNGGYPDWLLTRPDYRMPLRDVLEGRYPATATLQNARSDDAAAEWLANKTHLRYGSRWLRRALDEFRPYADRVVAVQLDDDQGAYIDNQTYPAPHLHAYLDWLEREVRAVVGPATPVFINTYQMRVPASSPVWTMGNWYQSDAYTIGEHDRTELDFSTLLLATNRRGPLAQSEFQAGWLAGPEDPHPRPADPRNTALALFELVALGAQGVIDFPLQDTYAEPGWEAPFSNAFYGWDAALRADLSHAPRYAPTLHFGAFVKTFAPVLLAARRDATIAIGYGEPPPRSDSTRPPGAEAIVARVRDALTRCNAEGIACDVVDVRQPLPRRYATIVVSPELAAAAPDAVAALRRVARVVDAVPTSPGSHVTTLRGALGSIAIAANWDDTPLTARYAGQTFVVAPHAVIVRLDDVALSALGAPGDGRRIGGDCDVASGTLDGRTPAVWLAREEGCTATLRDGARRSTLRLGPGEALLVPSLHRVAAPLRRPLDELGVTTRHAEFVEAPMVTRARDPESGAEMLTLANDRLALTFDPAAGARAFHLRVTMPDRTVHELFDATGALRDTLSAPLPPSPRDYIARYTHGYPAGTFNRTYDVAIAKTAAEARVTVRYAMPDAPEPGTVFERTLSLAPRASQVVVDERLVVPPGSPERAVLVSSLPALLGALAAGDLDASAGGVDAFRDGAAFAVAWRPGDVERASWTPYRSTGTLALTLAPGLRRVVIGAAPVASPEQARRFAEAERAWVAENPAEP